MISESLQDLAKHVLDIRDDIASCERDLKKLKKDLEAAEGRLSAMMTDAEVSSLKIRNKTVFLSIRRFVGRQPGVDLEDALDFLSKYQDYAYLVKPSYNANSLRSRVTEDMDAGRMPSWEFLDHFKVSEKTVVAVRS